MAKTLTDIQKQVLEFITGFLDEHGYPPALREIGTFCGITSTGSVSFHLKALEAKGYLKRDGSRSRGLEILQHPFRLPILGRVGAGDHVIAQEDVEAHRSVDRSMVRGASFMLRVRGESMTGRGIIEGDLVQVRQQKTANDGELVVAVVRDSEAGVVKVLRKRGGKAWLESAHPDHGPITEEFEVIGKVVGLTRDNP